MKYYSVLVILEVPDEEYAIWDSSCDETFHGPGKLHSPEQGVHVVSYDQVDENYFKIMKNTIFDEFGGI